jgi:ABC-type multidrug transport system fused ATPase/permease subunit
MSGPAADKPVRAAGGVLRLYAELWRFARGRRRLLFTAMTLLLVSQLAKLAMPYLSAHAINALQLRGLAGLSEAGRWLLLAIAALALTWVLHGPGRILERNLGLAIRQRVSDSLIDRLLSLPLSWHERGHSGASAHRVVQSSRALYDFTQRQYIYLQNGMRLIGPMIALWLIQPWVGLAAMLGFGTITLLVSAFDRVMVRLAHQENDAERRYTATMVDVLGNIVTIFALRQTRGVAALIRGRLLDINRPVSRAIVVNEAKWCVVDLMSQVLSFGLVALFAWLAAHRSPEAIPMSAMAGPTLLLGNVFMVWEYASQAGGVISAIAAHSQMLARQQADYASGDAIRTADTSHFAEAVPDAAGSAGKIEGWQRIEIRDLVYMHNGSRGSALALDSLAIALERGRRYALIGGSGAGKSTLLRVLAGLYLPQGLTLSVDGRTVATSPRQAARWLWSTATLIPQDAEVFEGSLAENLTLCESVLGEPPSPDRFPRALRLACASDFVDTGAAGLAMRIAERGANWSGGQRQRVALARGILAAEGSGLLLLDEPTAGLDPTTERRVYDNLFAGFPDACIVSSVHRLHLLERFDEVLMMRNGRLVDRGSAAELLARSSEFRMMLAAQPHDEAVQ